MSEQSDSTPGSDVVELLLHHHREIRRLFAEVENSRDQERAEAFDRLRRFLAVHEAGEQEVVHPQARQSLPNGEHVVDARLREEYGAAQLVEDLAGLGVESPVFLAAVLELRNTVVDHAEREEHEEFPLVKVTHDEEQLRAMAVAVRAAEALATGAPRRGVDPSAVSVMSGTYAEMVEQARNAARQAARHPPGDTSE